jgi:TDG/mug DNA glycosylase family protein
VLPDVLAPGLRIVFCGSAAGHASARAGAYYAGPGNLFWPTLAKVGLTPRRLAPAEFREVLRYGLGLTDLCQTAAGADSDLPPDADDPAALRAKVLRLRPRVLAFVGKRAARGALGLAPGATLATGWQEERIGTARLCVLPSPAGTARRYWNERPWRRLAAEA